MPTLFYKPNKYASIEEEFILTSNDLYLTWGWIVWIGIIFILVNTIGNWEQNHQIRRVEKEIANINKTHQKNETSKTLVNQNINNNEDIRNENT